MGRFVSYGLGKLINASWSEEKKLVNDLEVPVNRLRLFTVKAANSLPVAPRVILEVR